VIDVEHRVVARTIDLKEYQRPHGMAFLPGDTLVAVTSEAKQAVLFVDFRSGAVVRTLPTNGRASHMLSLSATGERMAIANIADNAITMLTLSPAGEPRVIPVARQPEGIAITPDGNTVWVGSNRDSVVLVVDARAGVLTDTLRGFALPYRVAISPDGRRAVVTDPAKATVRIFDVASRRNLVTIDVPRDSIVATAEVPGSPSPEGVAISTDGRWAFVTLQGRNRVVTIDLDAGTIVQWAPTGTWSDGIAYSRLIPRI
jgi:DNA-binding beta-propeller fold protein YncE